MVQHKIGKRMFCIASNTPSLQQQEHQDQYQRWVSTEKEYLVSTEKEYQSYMPTGLKISHESQRQDPLPCPVFLTKPKDLKDLIHF